MNKVLHDTIIQNTRFRGSRCVASYLDHLLSSIYKRRDGRILNELGVRVIENTTSIETAMEHIH